jgi:uncharacterized RmlC-like cupin family protein
MGSNLMESAVRLIQPGKAFIGKQGVAYPLRVTRDTAGTRNISVALLPMPPGVRANVHYHDEIETIACLIEGECAVFHGDRLEERTLLHAGECLYLPAGIPHAPFNQSGAPCTWVVTHSAGDDQEGIIMLPELDALLDAREPKQR